jgi:hypothetical protein
LKGFEEKLKSLGQSKLYGVAQAKFNKLHEWLAVQPKERRQDLLMGALRDRKKQADERKRRSIEDDRISLASIPKRFK